MKITLNDSLVEASGCSRGWTLDPAGYIDSGSNIDSDPLFFDPIDPAASPTTLGNLRLPKSSPAVDKGNNDFVSVTYDLDKKARKVNGDMDGMPMVDMGVYEFNPYGNYLPVVFFVD